VCCVGVWDAVCFLFRRCSSCSLDDVIFMKATVLYRPMEKRARRHGAAAFFSFLFLRTHPRHSAGPVLGHSKWG